MSENYFPPPWTDVSQLQKGATKSANTLIIISVVSSLVGFVFVIFIVTCCFIWTKKANQVIVQDWTTAVAPPRYKIPTPTAIATPRNNNTSVTVVSGPRKTTPTIVAPPRNNPNNTVQVWESTASSMENFLQEMARQKPVRFTAQQLFSFTSNYSTRLGSGGFGTVYKGQFPNGVRIAVKALKGADRKAEEQFMAEVGTIGRTYHINLVRLYGFCHDRYMSALVYEYMENGSLEKYLFKKSTAIKWEKLHEIAIGTARGLAYLHEECEQRIIHYDIKPENILLNENFTPKVGDFGLAKLCNRENTHITLSGYRGTPGYSAPEFLLKNHPITYKCDVYSFGMVLFEIIGRRRNNAAVGSSESLNWFPKHVWEQYEKGQLNGMTLACGIEKKYREKAETMSMVALWCVQDSPETRPPMSAVVKMLEGGVEVVPPPKPFRYLFSVERNPLETTGSSSYTTSTEDSDQSLWYKKTTPIMAKYEIKMASS